MSRANCRIVPGASGRAARDLRGAGAPGDRQRDRDPRGGGQRRERILRATVYIADVAHWPAFNAIYAEMLGAHKPARTVVPVPELHYGYLVEMDAIAALRGS